MENTEKKINYALMVLQSLFLKNHPQAKFAPASETVKKVLQLNLFEDLKDLAQTLQIDEEKDLPDYFEVIRLNVKLAVDIFHFFNEMKMVISMGPPADGEFFVAPKFRVGGQRIRVFYPAVVPVENANYEIVPSSQLPEMVFPQFGAEDFAGSNG